MNKKRIVISFLSILMGIILNVLIINIQMPLDNYDVLLGIQLSGNTDKVYELFYSVGGTDDNPGFTQEKSSAIDYNCSTGNTELRYIVPGNVKYIRLDFGIGESVSTIEKFNLYYKKNSYSPVKENLFRVLSDNQVDYEAVNDSIIVYAYGEDPHLVWNVQNWEIDKFLKNVDACRIRIFKVIYCFIIDFFLGLIIIFYHRLKLIPADIWRSRNLIMQLSKNDFKTKFAGSYLGTIWAFIQPIVTVLVYWFVFEKGFKAGGISTHKEVTVPYVLWLVTGIVPWFFFSDALNAGTNALIEYSYLVKKVVFKIDILPIVKIISALFVHVFFIGFTLILYAAYRYWPDLYSLQIIYYLFALFMCVLGLVYLTSALVLFFRDLTQLIGIVLQIGMWITPIMWNIDTMDLNNKILIIFKANPLYYIVSGYRDALINKVWFWEKPGMTLFFWGFTVFMVVVGIKIFRKLKIHFADVL